MFKVKTIVLSSLMACSMGAAASKACEGEFSLHVENHTDGQMIKVTEGLWGRSERVLLPNEHQDVCAHFGINALHVTYFDEATHQFKKIEHCPHGESFNGKVVIDVVNAKTNTGMQCNVEYTESKDDFERFN